MRNPIVHEPYGVGGRVRDRGPIGRCKGVLCKLKIHLECHCIIIVKFTLSLQWMDQHHCKCIVKYTVVPL